MHRYPDRALLKPLLICPVYCRFCFRREHVGPGGGLLTEGELQVAYAWLRERPAIREVILTGGDPLMLSPRRLAAIVAALSAIPHVENLRVHTRLPVADPARVTGALAAALATEKAMWVVVHANHAREFTPAARDAIRRVQAEGIPVLGQSVLLRGVNDSVEALESLFRAMVAARVSGTILHSSIRDRYRAVSCADRGRPPFARWPTRAGDRARLAHLRAGYSRRLREGADWAGLSRTGRFRARPGWAPARAKAASAARSRLTAVTGKISQERG